MSISFAEGCERRITAEGNELRFYDVGRGETPVVLLHGLFGSPTNWLQIMNDLADHYHFYALQLPIDFGHNRRHTSFSSLGQLTEHVSMFFNEMGLDHAVVCGNSLGGQVALDFCVQQPERVDRLILSGSAGLFERSLAGGRPPRAVPRLHSRPGVRDFLRFQARGRPADRRRICHVERPPLPTISVEGGQGDARPLHVGRSGRASVFRR